MITNLIELHIQHLKEGKIPLSDEELQILRKAYEQETHIITMSKEMNIPKPIEKSISKVHNITIHKKKKDRKGFRLEELLGDLDTNNDSLLCRQLFYKYCKEKGEWIDRVELIDAIAKISPFNHKSKTNMYNYISAAASILIDMKLIEKRNDANGIAYRLKKEAIKSPIISTLEDQQRFESISNSFK